MDVVFDSRGVRIDARQCFLVGARAEYSLLDRACWQARLRTLRAAGFNTVVTSVPWSFHEPRQAAPDFEGNRDVSAFIQLAAEEGLWVILRVGPNVGAPFGGGGLPAWLAEVPSEIEGEASIRLREADPGFLRAVGSFWAHLFDEILNAPKNINHRGGLIAVQIEQEWSCGNDQGASAYLGELVRRARELGITVPLLTANGFWQSVDGAHETWIDSVEERALFAHTRQLRLLQPNAPQLVTLRGAAAAPDQLERALLETIAAGGMPIIDDAVAGVHRQTLGVTASDSIIEGSVLDLNGCVCASGRSALRVLQFAARSEFLLSELDSAFDVPSLQGAENAVRLVPRAGDAGEVIYALRDANDHDDDTHAVSSTLVLADGHGMELPVAENGSWALVDVDLEGNGTLNQCNVPAYPMCAGHVLVLVGAAGSTVRLSINGSAREVEVAPATSADPVCVEHQHITLVCLNHAQAQDVLLGDEVLFLGAAGIDADGEPMLAEGSNCIRCFGVGGELEPAGGAANADDEKIIKRMRTLEWSAASLGSDVDGTSDRYARIETPASMNECGAASQYGFYRVSYIAKKTGKRRLYFPEGPHRLTVFLDGKSVGELGEAQGSANNTLNLAMQVGQHNLAVLVECVGGAPTGNKQVEPAGLHAPVEVQQRLVGVRRSVRRDELPIDLFAMRAFVPETGSDGRSSALALVWSFTHRRRTALRVDPAVLIPGTWVLNGEPIARLEATGTRTLRLASREMDSMKAGKNELVFRPDDANAEAIETMRSALRIDEIIEELGADSGSLAFSRWSVPSGNFHNFAPLNGAVFHGERGVPSWNRAQLDDLSGALAIDCSKMSRGVIFLGGVALGRYDNETAPILPIPASAWAHGAQLDVFDELGADPRSIRFVPMLRCG